MHTKIGTPYYMAPEVLEGSYNEACDMWSVGVIAYCILCGYPPFNAENDSELFRKIKFCDYEFVEADWIGISEDAKRFIEGLIKPDYKKRMTPEKALDHPWIQNCVNEPISPTVIKRLLLFK